MKEIELWIARDEDGGIYLYSDKPRKYESGWYSPVYNVMNSLCLEDDSFPEVQWSDSEPTKVKLTIENSMEKIKSILQIAPSQILRLIKTFKNCVFAFWRVLLGIIYFVLCWVFVAIIAIIDILADGFNLQITKEWAGEMQTLEDFLEDLKCNLKYLSEYIKS